MNAARACFLTDAAFDLSTKLYMFWRLAAGSQFYSNWGSVQRAINSACAGVSDGFQRPVAIHAAVETKNYVPKLQAVRT